MERSEAPFPERKEDKNESSHQSYDSMTVALLEILMSFVVPILGASRCHAAWGARVDFQRKFNDGDETSKVKIPRPHGIF